MNIVLVSTYDLGHQPFGLAEPAAWLRARGDCVRMLDLAVENWDDDSFLTADLVAFHVPMHTATRLAARLIPRLIRLNPEVHIAAFGLYAPTNEVYLRDLGVDTVLGGEYEAALTALAARLESGAACKPGEQPEARISLARQPFLVPDRSGLPPLERYAFLCMPDGEQRIAGYVEASRGCKHRCRHCPVVPVYNGRFRTVPRDIVLADIHQQVAAGARHISFGDPDFFNGPTHAMRIVEELNAQFPELTYDVIIKVEHLLAHRRLLPILKRSGCLFVNTAIESIDDEILARLDKGHTRADFYRVVRLFEALELALTPTFVAFTLWTTLGGYLDLLAAIAELGLVRAVAPVQLAIRLLIPPGSRLLELQEVRDRVRPLDKAALVYPWSSIDPRVDELQAEVQRIVQQDAEKSQEQLFNEVWALAHEYAGRPTPTLSMGPNRGAPAKLSEPWYCCAEPTDDQLAVL